VTEFDHIQSPLARFVLADERLRDIYERGDFYLGQPGSTPQIPNLSAGEHYMQVSKWLGHSTFVLTLTTYADYINEDDQAAPKVGRGVVATGSVVPLQRRAGSS
jgi:hypothetical protein